MKLIPSRGARAFYQKILESHKNPEQWAQELGIPERPDIPVSPSTALLRAAALKVKAGEISVGRAAELFERAGLIPVLCELRNTGVIVVLNASTLINLVNGKYLPLPYRCRDTISK